MPTTGSPHSPVRRDAKMTVIEGRIESITFRNEASRYTVARFSTGTPGKPFTVVGAMNRAAAGQAMKLTGKWVTHPRYGQQFEIITAEPLIPATTEGIREYLNSGIIRGIGPATIRKILARFGEETMTVLHREPERLTEVKGIGASRAASIGEQWRTHCMISELTDFLVENGIKSIHAPRIFRLYGSRALEILNENPYRLADDMGSTGFIIADRIARRTGSVPETPERARACILHILQEGSRGGHVFLPLEQVISGMQKDFGIDSETSFETVEALAEEEKIVIEHVAYPGADQKDTRGIFLSEFYHAETRIAESIAAMQRFVMPFSGADAGRISALVEERFLVRLSGEQRRALETVLSNRVSVITGGPGTGKTTLIKSMAAAFTDMKERVCLAAPTGRAARRISELTRRPAHTIHKLLGFSLENRTFDKGPDNPVDADTIIVDEASMIDTLLMHHLLLAIPEKARLVLVGDMFQIAPVGAGCILTDIIDSESVPVCGLTEIFRQEGKSPIVANAHRIRDGLLPELAGSEESTEKLPEFLFIEAETPEQIAREIISLCSEALPRAFEIHPSKDIQVLCPVHKGEAGTISLNAKLQAALNPHGHSLPGTHPPFKAGDRVMHVKNNYPKDVYNGDTGIIVGVDAATREITINYEGRIVSYAPEETDEILLGYAITIHKSQGSEYPAVVIPLTTRHFTMLQRNLLYTAVTRARRIVAMVGTRKALSVAINNNRPQRRLTDLSRRLREACGHTVYV